MSLLRRRCSMPGCGKMDEYHDFVTGKCPNHGRWALCMYHHDRYSCPMCRPGVQDGLEATRRNAPVRAREQEAWSRYTADFRAQGYGAEAAEAMARRRFREEGLPSRGWTADDMKNERERAEKQRKIDAGELMTCPRCKHLVPASDGVILAHNVRRGSGEDTYYTSCEGEGLLAKGDVPPPRQTPRNRPPDWDLPPEPPTSEGRPYPYL
jgi:hypothetical protein